jgi:hypothetical protein
MEEIKCVTYKVPYDHMVLSSQDSGKGIPPPRGILITNRHHCMRITLWIWYMVDKMIIQKWALHVITRDIIHNIWNCTHWPWPYAIVYLLIYNN